MSSQWQNFLRNQGEWHGSFASINPAGEIGSETPSILNLESAEQDRLVRFRLRRFGPEGLAGPPISDHQQDYRSLGRQAVFFDTGAFCKGSMQLAPQTEFGAEYGFVGDNRRHRLVQLYSRDGHATTLVLIREWRAGSASSQRPHLQPDQLLGPWQGTRETVSADWPEPQFAACSASFAAADLAQFQLLPDGGYSRRPDQVSHRCAFSVEAGWLSAPGRLERLIRHYDASGAWLSACHERLSAG
jgi:hypothetical protein